MYLLPDGYSHTLSTHRACSEELCTTPHHSLRSVASGLRNVTKLALHLHHSNLPLHIQGKLHVTTLQFEISKVLVVLGKKPGFLEPVSLAC